MSFDPAHLKTESALVLARHNISLIQQWSDSLTYESLSADITRCYAIQYVFINLAEAVKHIPSAILEKYSPASYWRDIIDFRNHLAHTYDDKIDHRIMETIHSDIPHLDALLQKIMTNLESATP